MKTINPQIQKLHEPRRNLEKTTPRNITLNFARTSEERRAEQSRREENRGEYTNIPQILVIIEMNIKTTMRYDFKSIRMAIINIHNKKMMAWTWRKRNHIGLLQGL